MLDFFTWLALLTCKPRIKHQLKTLDATKEEYLEYLIKNKLYSDIQYFIGSDGLVGAIIRSEYKTYYLNNYELTEFLKVYKCVL
jgi:hypothetical protein